MIVTRPRLLLAICFLLSLIIFTIDIMLPLGVAAGVPYIIVILTSLYIPDNKSTIVFALITSTLTILGLFASPIGGEEWKVFLNRALALLAIWVTTFVTLLIKNSNKEKASLNKNLENLVTERTRDLKNAQAELIEASRMAALGQLTSTVSHELRNPLSVINASIYLLKNKLDHNDEKTVNYMDKIETNIKRCDYIIDELLDFSRNETAILTTQKLDKLIESTIDKYQIPEQIRLKCNFTLDDTCVQLDAAKIQRVINNALDNACHAILNNENQHACPEISIETRLSEGRLQILIQDNGPGIATAHLGKIFEPLFSTKSFGIGLGLPIIRKIMEQHGGGADIINLTENGTRLLLWMPDKLMTGIMTSDKSSPGPI